MAKSGGGITGKNVVRGPGRMGQPAREMRPKGVSQIGQQMGNHATGSGKNLTRSVEAVRGQSVRSVTLGNETSKSAGQGPGSGRTVMATGSQGQHGAVAGSPPQQGRDILGPRGGRQP